MNLAAWKAACEGATPGPWEAELDQFTAEEGIVATVADVHTTFIAKIETGILVGGDLKTWTVDDDQRRDAQWAKAKAGEEIRIAQFIALARTALPDAIQHIEELESDNDDLRNQLTDVRGLYAHLRKTSEEEAGELATEIERLRALVEEACNLAISFDVDGPQPGEKARVIEIRDAAKGTP